MAGHSKWANIQHRKGRQDEKRGRVFSRLAKEITVAARMGGGDPGFNPRLRLAVDRAKAVNMPADNIDRAVKKGTGELEGADYTEVLYEAYGPGGVAIMIQAVTDNPTRTVANIHFAFKKGNGNLGNSGSIAFMFDHFGVLRLSTAFVVMEHLLPQPLADFEAATADLPAGIEEVLVYPNPAADRLTLSFTARAAAPVSLRLLNNAGQTVWTGHSQAVSGLNVQEINHLPSLPAGVYTLQVQLPAGQFSRSVAVGK